MSQFYSTEQTASSRRVLDELLGVVPQAVLIGGWASWVRTGGPMSHDIDLIVSHGELAIVDHLTGDVSLSTHIGHKKWRASYNNIHVDLYVPYESRLGRHLALRVEDLVSQVEIVDGYHVLTTAAHIATKWAALLDRPDSLPGEKDRFELRHLLAMPGAHLARDLIITASERSETQTLELIGRGFDYLREERGITKQQRMAISRHRQLWDLPPSSQSIVKPKASTRTPAFPDPRDPGFTLRGTVSTTQPPSKGELPER